MLAPQVVTCRGVEFVNYRMELRLTEPDTTSRQGRRRADGYNGDHEGRA